MDEARTWLPRALSAAAFALYALAVPAGPTWQGAAGLAAAVARLGCPHPPGFPLYCVLAKAASLVPVGEIAFRVHLASAACAALAVLWVSRIVSEACRGDAPALVGSVAAGAALAVPMTFFRQATVASALAPTAALAALALWLLARVARGAGGRAGLGWALAAGLGLALHPSFAVVLPVAGVLFLVRLRRGARWPLAAPLVVVTAVGALYAYLPLRAATARAEAASAANPRDLSALWEHVRPAAVAGARPEMADAARLAGELGDQLGPGLLVAAAGGAVWLALRRRERWLLAAVLVAAGGDAALSLWLDPVGVGALRAGVALIVAISVLAGAGVAWLARYAGRAGPYLGGAATVIVVLPPALASWEVVWPAAPGEAPRAWIDAALADVPPGGAALAGAGPAEGLVVFATAAEGARPDAALRGAASGAPRLPGGEPRDLRAAARELTSIFAGSRDPAAARAHAAALADLARLARRRGDPELARTLAHAAHTTSPD